MFGALLYLRLTSLKNLLTSRLLRLRQPKYLAGAIVGGAYFWFVFFRRPAGPNAGQHHPVVSLDHLQQSVPEYLPLVAAIGALLLFIGFLLMWFVPSGPATLSFSEAEIAFLFPAPVTRRSLVNFKLLSSQFRILFGAAIMTLFSNRWTILGGSPLTHAIGWWFVFSAINLHLSGSSFTLTRLSQNGMGVLRRRLFVAALMIVTVSATLKNLPPTVVEPDPLSLARWLALLAGTAPLAWLVFPVRLVLAPFFSPDGHAFLIALGPAVAVLVAHYFWVVQSVVSFEDAAIVKAEKRAVTVAAWRSGERRFGSSQPKSGRQPAFKLASHGRPELAFLWKNLLSTHSFFSLRTFAITAGAILLLSQWAGRHEDWRPVLTAGGAFALMIGVYLLIVGPQFARQDIRSDLTRTDILKTYPLAGWQIILGELLTPTAILTGLIWLVGLTAAATVHPQHGDFGWLTPTRRLALAGGLLVITPALVMLQLLVPNAATLLFPAWFQSSRRREGGVEVMGQRMIFFLAQMVTMLVALLPAALLAGGVAFALQWLLGPIAAGLGAMVVVLAVLLVEIAGGVWWLGRRFEKFDLSSDLQP